MGQRAKLDTKGESLVSNKRLSPVRHIPILALVLGFASIAFADTLWQKAERGHLRNVKANRKNRKVANETAAKISGPNVKRVQLAKAAIFGKSLELCDAYEAAINAKQRVKAKKIREAIHLLRLKAELLGQAQELYTTANGYKLAKKKVKAAVTETLRNTAKKIEAQASAYDEGIQALSQ